MWWIIGAVIIGGAAAWGPIVSSNIEQVKYTVVKDDGAIELRNYAPHIVAATKISGEQKVAISQGFRIIADYIFGNNEAATQVAMTAPVIQHSSKKIAMTAPVIQQGDGESWKIQFVMPASYTLKNLPKPKNDAVKLVKIPAKYFAVIRFSGISSEESLKLQTEALNNYILAHNLKMIAPPSYAFFNPPWTLPFLRRNEVMIEIATDKLVDKSAGKL